MNRNDIMILVKKTISEVLKDEELFNKITESTDLVNEIGITSLEGIEILVRLEDVFNIEIEDDELSIEIISTISDCISFVEAKLLKS